MLRAALALAPILIGVGCAVGPRGIEQSRLAYNRAVKRTNDEQLLLNIVRLRYTDNPVSVTVNSIADQHEFVAGLQLLPFYTSAVAGDVGSYRGTVLPSLSAASAERPTVSYAPLEDQSFAERLFEPLSLDAIAALGKSTRKVSTVYRLALESINSVSNAERGSGPTPEVPQQYERFRAGVEALQRLQDRGQVAFSTKERFDATAELLPANGLTVSNAIDAARGGLSIQRSGDSVAVGRNAVIPLVVVAPSAVGSADGVAFAEAFRLEPNRGEFELGAGTAQPFAPGPFKRLDVEPRSILQSLFFLSHGVVVPPGHLASGVAPSTAGGAFDWNGVLSGLFRVESAKCDAPPSCAHVAVQYERYWFWIDKRDRDTKATFTLITQLIKFRLGEQDKKAPVLTLPIGE